MLDEDMLKGKIGLVVGGTFVHVKLKPRSGLSGDICLRLVSPGTKSAG